MRATCVDSTRSVGLWNVPTFSAREWRSAALEVDGANGSCTRQTSSGRIVSRSSIVRDTSTGSAGTRRPEPGRSGSASPTASTRGGAAGLGQQRVRIVDRGPQRLARLADRVVRARGRDDDDPVPAAGELDGHALDVTRDVLRAARLMGAA